MRASQGAVLDDRDAVGIADREVGQGPGLERLRHVDRSVRLGAPQRRAMEASVAAQKTAAPARRRREAKAKWAPNVGLFGWRDIALNQGAA